MDTDVFKLIKRIVERNEATEYYSLEIVTDDRNGERYLTCDNNLSFPECSSDWMFSDVSDDEATVLLTAFIERSNLFTF